MGAGVFIGFLSLSLVICISPGPSMLFVIQQGMSKDWKNVLAGVVGLLAANTIWTLLCAFGVGVVMQNSQQLFHVIKFLGAIYLVYLGATAIFRSNKPGRDHRIDKTISTFMAVFVKGFLTSMSNPKALLFYMAFLPQFVSGNYPYSHEILFLGAPI